MVNSSRWENEQRLARQVLDECECAIDVDGIATLEGVLQVKSQHGRIYDSIVICIKYPRQFPRRNIPPTVVLKSHRDRWRASADAHIYSDWSLCLFVLGDSEIDFQRNDSLNSYLGLIHTFLFKEWYYQKQLALECVTGVKARWPGEARSHGFRGIAEAMREMGHVGRNSLCPCGSGNKIKECCSWLLRR